MANPRKLPLCALVTILLCSTALTAQNAAPALRIVSPIDENQLVTLKGNVNPHANAQNDRGPVSPGFPMTDIALVLSRSPEQQAAFDAFVAGQYDSSSPNFHNWLMPEEIGTRFGPADADIAAVTNWLTGHGFAIIKVSKDRMSIRFSGTAGQVEGAFHTQIHNLSVNNVPHFANMTDPQIPAALAPVVVGVKALHNFLPHPLHRLGSKVTLNNESGKWQRVVNPGPASQTTTGSVLGAAPEAASAAPRPQFGINAPANPTSGSSAYLEEDLAPYDFATIYNVLPLWNSKITGSGQTIAIAGTSEINLADVTAFRQAFGLPAGLAPKQVTTNTLASICTSTSPSAYCGIGDLEENSLDVELSGAVAPAAQVVLVVTGQNTSGSIDTVYDSAQYVVENLTAKILSVSYGACELSMGTSGNVAYYNLWQSAAAEGISVFVASGDSGSPACDQGGDAYGEPYSAQYGLSVNGLASTPYNTAVGGTDFSWCKPVVNGSGVVVGCPTTSSSASPYWSASNNTTTGASAAGYVPETPWNDSCLNPIWAGYLESIASALGYPTPNNAEAACNFVQNNWSAINTQQQQGGNGQFIIAYYVDTVGGGGGASHCVVNNTTASSTTWDTTSCGTATSTGAANGSIPLHNDGWIKPSWQSPGSVTGIPNDGVRDLPDVSFFAGDGSLDSATLICVSAIGACVTSSQVATNPVTVEPTAQEVGGTSVGAPEMAGVMALINQKAGAPQGLPNAQLYQLAGKQNYSSCSAESVKASGSCYFNDIDTGTNTMPCDYGATIGGITYQNGNWVQTQTYNGIQSPNCAPLTSGDQVGTLVSSGTTPAYNGAVGFDMATGLGSLNVANVVNAWVSDAGTAAATVAAKLSATTISANIALTVTVTVTGSGSLGTPTGPVVVSGGGYNATQTLAGGTATITIPANSLAPGSDTLTVTYAGDSNYASANTTVSVMVTAVVPTVAVVAVPTSQNAANSLAVSVTVSGPLGAPTPTGTVTLSGGGYNSTAVTLSSSGTAAFTVPAGALAVGTDTLTVTYSGNSTYYGLATGSASVTIVSTPPVTPTVKVTASPATIETGQSLSVTVNVSGTAGIPTGNLALTAGSYTSAATLDNAGNASFTIPASSLTAGTVTVTATYSGDAIYSGGVTGKTTVTVTQSTYALAATAVKVAPGATTGNASTITGTQSTTGYTGTVTLKSCALTSSTVTNPSAPPSCSVTGTITYTSGTPSGSGTATVITTATVGALVYPKLGNRKGWLGVGGEAVLALLVFLGIPARRRSWRAMLGILIVIVALGSLSGCGGGVGGGGGGITPVIGTTPGSYTFTVTGTGSDPANTTGTATFTVTVS